MNAGITLTLPFDWLDVQAGFEWLALAALLAYVAWSFAGWVCSAEGRRIRAGVRRMMRERNARGLGQR